MAGQALLQHGPEEQLCREGERCRAMKFSACLPCSALLLHPGFLCAASRRPGSRRAESLTPAAIQLNLWRWVPVLGYKRS